MNNWKFRWLSALVALCMLLGMPAAMMEEGLPAEEQVEAEVPETEAALEPQIEETVTELGGETEEVTYEAQYDADLDWEGPVFHVRDAESGLGVDPGMQILLMPEHEGTLSECVSHNEAIATIDENGLVTVGNKIGRVDIELKYEDGARYLVHLTVNDPSIPRSIRFFNVADREALEVGEILTVEYKVIPESAPQDLQWESSDKSIAAVNARGQIKAKKAGAVTITATAPFGAYVSQKFFLKVIDPEMPGGSGLALDDKNFPDDAFRDFVQFYCDTNNDSKLSAEEIAAVKSLEINGRLIDARDTLASLKGIGKLTALESLEIANFNNLKSVDLSGNKALKALDMSDDDAIAALNLSANTDLRELHLHNLPALKSLDIAGCKKLTLIHIGEVGLTSLNVKNNTKLKELECWDSPFAALDVSNNTLLELLDCGDTEISALNVTKNTRLVTLICGGNPDLSKLDVSRNTKLKLLDCGGTGIKTLDISKCPELIKLVRNVKPEIGRGDILFDYDDDRRLVFVEGAALKGVTAPQIITASSSAIATAYVGVPLWIESASGEDKSFATSDSSIASVKKSTGLITPKKAGNVKIAVNTKQGDRIIQKLKVVNPTDPVAVAISQGTKRTMKVNQTGKLTVKYKSVPGYKVKTTLQWKSSDKTVVKVNKTTGQVKALKKGKATVAVRTANGLIARINLTVK